MKTCCLKVLAALCVIVSFAHAKWISFNGIEGKRNSEVKLRASTQSSLSLDIDVFGINTDEINTNEMINNHNETFVLFSFSDENHTVEVGKPKLPVIRKTIGVPYNASVGITVVNSQYRDISLQTLKIDKRIMPVVEPVMKLPGHRPVLKLDQTIYSSDTFYPQEIAGICNEGVMRGHRLVMLEIAPIQYNPASGSIRCYTDLEIKVSFRDGDMSRSIRSVKEDYSPIYEDFVRKRVFNYDFYRQMFNDLPRDPVHYLIITHDDFKSRIQPLADWYKKTGFKVEVANQSTISNWTTEGIQTYIRNQSPYPTFLLLVGDLNGDYMPAFNGSSTQKETDLYYATKDDQDYLPDCGYARFPCKSTDECNTMVDKTLKYAKAKFTSFDWILRAALLCGIDRPGLWEGTHNHCIDNFLEPHGYTTHKLYEDSYNATTQDAIDALTEGVSQATFTGHGSPTGWQDGPPIYNSDLNDLDNGEMLVFAQAYSCNTNQFSTDPCFGELWLKKSDGGGVGYYGSAPTSYGREDDILQRAVYASIYEDSIYEFSLFTDDGMYDGIYNGSSNMKKYYYEGYGRNGDPALHVWTDIPEEMEVTHNSNIPQSPTDFAVHVAGNSTPLQDALVCCWINKQNPEVHEAGYTDASGDVLLNVSPQNSGDTMFVTVTKHNYIPYEGFAIVGGTGIDELDPASNQSALILSQDISQGFYTIDYNFSDLTLMDVELYNINGQLVKQLHYKAQAGPGDIKINMRHYAHGVYFVKLFADPAQGSFKHEKVSKVLLLQ